jgi:hypothetical protein
MRDGAACLRRHRAFGIHILAGRTSTRRHRAVMMKSGQTVGVSRPITRRVDQIS